MFATRVQIFWPAVPCNPVQTPAAQHGGEKIQMLINWSATQIRTTVAIESGANKDNPAALAAKSRCAGPTMAPRARNLPPTTGRKAKSGLRKYFIAHPVGQTAETRFSVRPARLCRRRLQCSSSAQIGASRGCRSKDCMLRIQDSFDGLDFYITFSGTWTFFV